MKQTKRKNWNYYCDMALAAVIGFRALHAIYTYNVAPERLMETTPARQLAGLLSFAFVTGCLFYQAYKAERLEAALDAKVDALEAYHELVMTRFNGVIHIPRDVKDQQVVFDGVAFDFFKCDSQENVGITIEMADTLGDEDAPCVDLFVSKTTLELFGETQGLRSLPVGGPA